MRKLLHLAWRNVWRNRRRSLITMAAVTFAMLIIAAATSIQNGTYDVMEGLAVQLYSGHVQIHRAGFFDERTLDYSLEDDDQDWDRLFAERDWEVAGFARRITGFGLVSSDSSSAGAMVVGIEPGREEQVTTFSSRVFAGSALEPGDDGALVGVSLAANLGVGVGDTLAILTQGYQNALGADLYPVRGLLRTGSAEVDRAMMIIGLGRAQELFSMEGRITELVVNGDYFRRAPRYAADLKAALSDDRFEVMSWEELMPELRQTRALDDAGNYVFYAFLLILVGFEIFNSSMMSIMERVREFGVLQAIGMKPHHVSALVSIELSIKVIVAIAFSTAIMLAFTTLFPDLTIPLSESLTEAYQEFGFYIEGMTFSGRPIVFWTPICLVGIVAFVAILYPVIRVGRFSPMQAMRRV